MSILEFEIDSSDSLDTVELVMAFEEEFDMSISLEDAASIQTLGDAIRFLERQRLGNPAPGETFESGKSVESKRSWSVRIWRFIRSLLKWVRPKQT